MGSDGSKSVPDGARWLAADGSALQLAQDGSKSAQERSKRGPTDAKMAQKDLLGRPVDPRWPQDGAKMDSDGANMSQDGPKMAPT